MFGSANALSEWERQWLLRKPLTPGESDFENMVDVLDDLTLRDLQQLIRQSRQPDGDAFTPEKLIDLYKFGEKASLWEDLNKAKLAGIEDALKRRVKDQDEAIRKVRAVIIRAFTRLSGLQHSRKQRMPKGVLFFVGPTGVGKGRGQ
jgi:flagellar biosynthesis GTPase FlhF